MAGWWIKLEAVFTLRQFRVFTVRDRMVRSTVDSPIFACRSRVPPHGPHVTAPLPSENTSLSPSTARCFHALTWFGCTLCRTEVVPENRTGC